MNDSDVLREALAAPDRGSLEPHRRAILELRRKKYSWREIAEFLNQRGVPTNHTKLFRFMTKRNKVGVITMSIPTADQYEAALTTVKMSDKQRQMLGAHYRAHNRTITATQLAKAAGEKEYKTANLMYGTLGRRLGETLKFPFVDLDPESGTKFQSSAIGMGMPAEYSSTHEFELVMHHELAKALNRLNWFPD